MTQTGDPSLTNHPRMPQLAEVVAQRYKILGVLGEGGFSVVYLAKDEHAGGRVAIKVLSPAKSANPRFAERFLREGRVVRELRHHNTIKIFDTGTTGKGCLFMVTEFLLGETLQSLLDREGALAPHRVVRITEQILHSLTEAHHRGVIHRDLKPANVMICEVAGEEDYVKVLDFGVAKAELFTKRQLETTPFEFIYTPQYSAPEVLTNAEVTPSTDVYSLGLMMIEMLTGRKAVDGVTVWHLMAQQVSAVPVAIPPEVADHPISRIIRKAVAKDPENRYPSAETMLEALMALGSARATLSDRPIASPATLEEEVSRQKENGDFSVAQAESRTPRGPPPNDVQSVSTHQAGTQVEGSPKPNRMMWWVASGLLVLVGGGAVWVWLSLHSGGGHPSPEAEQARRSSPRIGPTALESEQEGCEAGDFERCIRLAQRYELGQGVGVDSERAVEYLHRGCEVGGIPTACLELADRYRNGRGVDADPERSLSLAAEACRRGSMEACVQTGYEYLQGTLVSADFELAYPLMQAACEGGLPRGCAGLAMMLANGWGLPQDLPRAVQLYSEACDAALWEACTHLGVLIYRGQGVPQDFSLARSLFERACEHEDMEGCVNLAAMYHRGLGVDIDGQEAYRLYERACLWGAGVGCAGLASLVEQGLGVDQDLSRSRELYRKACSMEAPVACFNLANMLAEGRGGPADAEASRQFFQRACDLGHQRGCQAAAPE